VIFKEIVYPLHELLTDMKWIDDKGDIIRPRSEQEGPRKSGTENSQPLDNIEAGISPESEAWLKEIQGSEFSEHLRRQFFAKRKTVQRIKIAVLDTGYDSSSNFFKDEIRPPRITWKDFHNDSEVAQDEDGHGTQVLSLVMKVAPAADIYVVRVAKSSDALRKDSEQTSINVSKAISWAVDEGVDIISMSFGWTDEVLVNHKEPVISRAITKAIWQRDKKILFFAAASNYGALGQELFPANHESVTSIRATDSLGGFSNFNPPTRSLTNFGTLGVNVPCARRGSTRSEVSVTGTSMATPIAAGLAAVVLGFARLQLAPDKSESDHKWSKLWTRSGMENMFYQLSNDSQTMYCRYLSPVEFVNAADETRKTKMDTAVLEPV